MRRASSPRRSKAARKPTRTSKTASRHRQRWVASCSESFPAESGDQNDRKEPRAEEIKLTDLDEAQQAEWLRSREFLRQQLNNFAHLIVLDEGGAVATELANTPAGKCEGGCKIGGRTRFAGVVWDSRVNGERSSRPSARTPSLQIP